MKIIKMGEIPKVKKYIEVAKCSKCKTEMEFDRSECSKVVFGARYRENPYREFNFYKIKCPLCKKEEHFGESKEID